MRELFNALPYVNHCCSPWRALPNDFPPRAAVYQELQRWKAAEYFEVSGAKLARLLRLAVGDKNEPTSATVDHRTYARCGQRVACPL